MAIVRYKLLLLISVCFLALLSAAKSTQRRCYQCESRGHLGSCNDPFLFSNISEADNMIGVQVSAVPCSSGWCGKVIDKRENDLIVENGNVFHNFKSSKIYFYFIKIFVKKN